MDDDNLNSSKQNSQNIIESSHSIKHDQDAPQQTQKRSSTRRLSKIKTSRISNLHLTSWEQAKKRVEKTIDSVEWTIFMTIVTLYALFGDDIRILTTDKNGDIGFWVVTLICMSCFCVEIILASVVKDNYFLGFFFWLDILSTISMLLDVGWISDSIFGVGSGSSAVSAVSLARAGRASRVGTRAGRIVRVIRLIRLSKLYKAAKQTLEREALKFLEQEEREEMQNSNEQVVSQRQQQQSQQQSSSQQQSQQQQLELSQQQQQKQQQQLQFNSEVSSNLQQPRSSIVLSRKVSDHTNKEFTSSQNFSRQSRRLQSKTNLRRSSQPQGRTLLRKQSQIFSGQSQQQEIEETNIGKELNELTNKRVITIVMLILFSVPIFNLSTYKEETLSYDTGIGAILFWKQDTNIYNKIIEDYINFHSNLRVPLAYLSINSEVQYPKDNPDYYLTLRSSSQLYYAVDNGVDQAVAVANQSDDESLNAILSISRTLFVSIVLSIAAILFSKDVQDLVLTPVEKMLATVNKIAENPLAAASEEENQAYIQMNDVNKEVEDEKLETVVLQKLIVKIGALLALGFGEAGSQIVASNMNSKGQSINPMLPGKKVMAIFGFCDIRNFTDATEVLQQDVMVFVNEIAEIVHGTVDQFSGSANKNIGDAFLLVWKFNDHDYEADSEGVLSLKPLDHVAQIADMSILSFVTIITNVSLSPKLQKYKAHEGLNNRIPNYCVKMGFGLHLGWAIEGAIGSEYKIDASYLSPNVNMASRLEAATKQFGSFILISGQLRDVATRATKENLRHIDRVTVKGSIEPLDIYTVDINLDALNRRFSKKLSLINAKPRQVPILDENTKKKNKVIRRMKRDKLKQQIMRNIIRISDNWHKDPSIKLVRQIFNKEFYEIWDQGFNCYLAGDWDKSKILLEQTLTMLPNYRDGPSNTLLRVMKEESYLKNNWKGYRELTEK